MCNFPKPTLTGTRKLCRFSEVSVCRSFKIVVSYEKSVVWSQNNKVGLRKLLVFRGFSLGKLQYKALVSKLNLDC